MKRLLDKIKCRVGLFGLLYSYCLLIAKKKKRRRFFFLFQVDFKVKYDYSKVLICTFQGKIRYNVIPLTPGNCVRYCSSNWQTPESTICVLFSPDNAFIIMEGRKFCVLADPYSVHGFGAGHHVIERVLCSLKVLQQLLVLDLSPALLLTDLQPAALQPGCPAPITTNTSWTHSRMKKTKNKMNARIL